MSGAAVSAVLGLLRRLKRTDGLSLQHSSLSFLQVWAADHSPTTVLRMSIGISEQIEDARNAINASQLSDEAKEGLLATLGGLGSAFSLGGMHTSIQSYIPALDSAITNFAIVASMVDADLPASARAEIEELAVEIEGLRATIDDYGLEMPLREAVVRQLNALIALLRNADAVGVEPALAAYFELMWQLRKTKSADDEGKKSGLWSTVSAWSDRFTKVADLVDAGSKLLPVVEKAPDLLKFFG